MPRRARHYLADQPYHVVQRGNNRQGCFRELGDYRYYLKLWRTYAEKYKVEVHAYCLMTNHVHFLVTPRREDGVSLATKVVGSRYAHYVNKKYERTGTLWEGRHRSHLIQHSLYLLSCQRYIELNPVRAAMVSDPAHYPWSSFRENALGESGWMIPHQDFLALGKTDDERRDEYLKLFEHGVEENVAQQIREAVFYSQPLANEAFKQELKAKYGLPIGQMHAGAPRKQALQQV